MNKEPKEVDWSNQKPGTIGVTRGLVRNPEFIAARGGRACFYERVSGFEDRLISGRSNPDSEYPSDILLPWEAQVAEGHNPAGLTNSQVGEGWKLKALGEQVSRDQCERWAITNNWVAADRDFVVSKGEITTHRVPITKPKRRIPCGPEHFPPGVVLRKPGASAFWQVVTKVRSSEVMTPNYDGDLLSISFKQLADDMVERSIDSGKTWLPCYVETEE